MEPRKAVHGVRIATAASKTSTESGPRHPRRSTPELSRDREIIVKAGDTDGITLFRSMKSSGSEERAEKANTTGARQLKSGNLSLAPRTASDAEAARVYWHEWIKHLWKGAEVRMPSWSVVIHDVNVRSLRINRLDELRERKEAINKQFQRKTFIRGGKRK
ncbi:hypothetical protein N7499_012338 [Penicillium canescens]|nr:hypothetical protein N7499_012338 [Penicillium canescens]